MSNDEQRLLALLHSLDEEHRRQLIDYAEYLVSRHGVEEAPAPAPVDIPRPEQETVVAALQRLSATYPMLEKAVLLNETTAFMAQHIMEGRPAREVIDELEALFRDQYERFIEPKSRGEFR